MQFIFKYKWLLLFALLFLGANSYLMLQDNYFLNALPLFLLATYVAVFKTEQTLLFVVLLTPLSVNLEEFTEGRMGLFIPTEPLLFGLMLLVVMVEMKKSFLPSYIWKHPIVWAVGFYLFWILFTSIPSSHPIVSLKFLLVKLWFVIPVLIFGSYVFRKKERINSFVWLYVTGMVLVMIYTLLIHASYGFGEKEGHWVMSPFFKDHTIYGAAVALNLLLVLGLYFSKKHNPLTQLTLLLFIVVNLIALYFSYTRAAWLSVVAAFVVYLFIRFKVKFKYLLITGLTAIAIVALSWDQIQMELARNDAEHTTEEFGERLQSATNVTSDASNLERLNRWSSAWEMFKERPVFGFGPGTYAMEYAPFQDPEKLTIISTNFGNMGNAHSEYLGPLAETGFIGFISVLLLVIAIFYKGITLYINYPKEDVQYKRLILFMNLALVTYFVHGVLNNYLDTDKASVPIWGMCAAFIALENSMKKRKKLS
ncbi:MAG: O-antigen ligase family protein [Lishizhenia sp.]